MFYCIFNVDDDVDTTYTDKESVKSKKRRRLEDSE